MLQQEKKAGTDVEKRRYKSRRDKHRNKMKQADIPDALAIKITNFLEDNLVAGTVPTSGVASTADDPLVENSHDVMLTRPLAVFTKAVAKIIVN